MVFKRRDKPPFSIRMRELLYPRRGWRRAIEYLGHRVRRLPDTPHRIALGFACGLALVAVALALSRAAFRERLART